MNRNGGGFIAAEINSSGTVGFKILCNEELKAILMKSLKCFVASPDLSSSSKSKARLNVSKSSFYKETSGLRRERCFAS